MQRDLTFFIFILMRIGFSRQKTGRVSDNTITLTITTLNAARGILDHASGPIANIIDFVI